MSRGMSLQIRVLKHLSWEWDAVVFRMAEAWEDASVAVADALEAEVWDAEEERFKIVIF